MRFLTRLAGLVNIIQAVNAQFPAKPVGMTTLQSKLQPGVTIDYKETTICETTPGVKSYSGSVRFPAGQLPGLATYDINTFFWYFEARHNSSTAPLAIYLAGGPGESSTYSALSSESGPCYANPDGKSTTINPWSFNNHVNMLYIDQPVQTGFSYDTLVNGTYDVISTAITPMDSNQLAHVVSNGTVGVGTYASQNPLKTTNTTVASAKVLSYFTENWLTSFPEYRTSSKKISVWTNSYGGYWGPAFVSSLLQKLAQTSPSSPLHGMTIDTLGLTNACVDLLNAGAQYAEFEYNNTYGVEFIPEPVYKAESHNFTKPGGSRDLILQCRELGEVGDPDWIGANDTVNEACNYATEWCTLYASLGAFDVLTTRYFFDVAVQLVDGNAPCPFYLSASVYLNQPHVQAALGVPVNFTYDSNIVDAVLGTYNSPSLKIGTGDSVRKGIHDLEYALSSGVKVAMIFGDRDLICNWLGGEAIANSAAWPHQKMFQSAGYESFITNSTYHGGVTKQFGPLSFTRVFEAGHSVSAYQPETVYQIFMRSMFGTDVATGKKQVGEMYASKGPASNYSWKSKLPKSVPNTCMVQGSFQNVSVWEELTGTV